MPNCREGLAQRAPRPASAIGKRAIEDHGKFGGRRRAAAGCAHQTRKETWAPASRQGADQEEESYGETKEESSNERAKETMTTEITIAPVPGRGPAALFTPTQKAAERVVDFFTSQINNENTRKAYLNATRRFAEWCQSRRIRELSGVKPFHVAAFVKELKGDLAPPSVKQHLAALRMLFDWLVTGHIIDVNPAHAVRGCLFHAMVNSVSTGS